ncbi:MAG TPA: twin-arginine translocase subunit TatC, partial [Candidatus Saccharimonadales bacterium]|nr:twin-arginine translocase subunit TatC [Candidatus Saccharimonadales bacterium]
MAGVLQPDDQRSVHEHLRELRGRLLWWVVFLVIFGGIALYFQRPLSAIVVAPLKSKLYYTSPLGGVDFLFKIVLVFGLIPSFPVLIYQILRFVEPALPQKLGKILPKMIFSSIALTIGSIIFSYSPAGLPLIFKFLHVFDSPEVQPLINAQEYFSFVMWYLVLIDIFIQLPLVLVVINHITPISLKKLNKYQFYILLGLFLLAGLITPGIDPRPQLVLFVPMALVFELAVFSIYLTNRKRNIVSPRLIDLEAKADQLYQAGNTKAARNLYAEICVNKDAAAKSHARMG